MTARVVVVAEVRMYRDGLAEAIARRSTDFTVVGTASSVEEWGALDAEVALVDAATPGVLEELRRGGSERVTAIVAFGVPEMREHVVACVEAGVAGFVPRDAGLDDVVAAVESAARGEALVTPTMAATLIGTIRELSDGRPTHRVAARLTDREREVAQLLHEGLSNKQVALRLSIQLSTVKNHVHSILGKVAAERRSEAVARLREEAGLVDPRI